MARIGVLLMSIAVVVLATGLRTADGKIIGKPVEYSVQGKTLKGYLAYDDSMKGKRPGVLVVHEWWGLNDYLRKRANMLAKLGYTALALDMYGEGTIAAHPEDAKKFSSEVMKNFDTAKARFSAAQELLQKQPTVDPHQLAAIGYCFGGGVVLNMAAQGANLKGVVSFHGSLSLTRSPQPGEVKAKMLVLHGANDKFVTPEQIDLFKKAMKTAGAEYKFIAYPDAMHAFTNPDATANGKKFNMPIAYNEKADRQSWEEMKKFFKDIFK